MIRRVDEAPADHDHREHDRHLQDDDQVVDPGGFLDAPDQQTRENREDHHGRDVHDSRHAIGRGLKRRVIPLVRYLHPHEHQHAVRILAPRNGDGGRADRVFEDQVPADDPGE